MRIFTIIVRTITALVLLFASITYFIDWQPGEMPKISDEAVKFNVGMDAAKYLLPLVKTLELLAGLSFISGLFVPLFSIVILPVSINAFLVHAFLMPDTIAMAAILLIGNLYLLYACRDRYSAIFMK